MSITVSSACPSPEQESRIDQQAPSSSRDSCCCHKVLSVLENLSNQMGGIQATQQFLMSEVSFIKLKLQQMSFSPDSGNAKSASVLKLPVTSKNEFLELEEKFKNSESAKSEVRNILQQSNSLEYSKFIKGNLKRLLTDEAAYNFTWTSANENVAVKNFELIDLLTETAASKFNVTKDNCEDIVKKWFRDAKNRKYGRSVGEKEKEK